MDSGGSDLEFRKSEAGCFKLAGAKKSDVFITREKIGVQLLRAFSLDLSEQLSKCHCSVLPRLLYQQLSETEVGKGWSPLACSAAVRQPDSCRSASKSSAKSPGGVEGILVSMGNLPEEISASGGS